MTLNITPTFDLRTGICSILDITDISSIASFSGIFEVLAPTNNIIYNNQNYNTPDVTKSSRTKTGIVLPLDSKGFVVNGNYIFTFKAIADGIYYEQDLTFNFQYQKVQSGLTLIPDGYDSTLSSVDGTNYSAYTIVSKTRTHSVTPPSLSPLSPVSQDEDIITYNADIWSGIWIANLLTVITYNINSIYVIDEIVDTITIPVYNINMEEIMGYYDNYFIAFKALTDKKAISEKSYTLDLIHSDMELYDKAVLYKDYLSAYNYAYEIVTLLGVSPTVEEIIPFIDPGGGAAPVTDDKWQRISNVVSPKNNSDRVAIGDSVMVSNELLNINGSARIKQINIGSGDGTITISADSNGNLVFKDANDTPIDLSQLVPWIPDNKDTLATYDQTNYNIKKAVTNTHPPLTVPEGSLLELDGTNQILDIQIADENQGGALDVSDYNDFKSRQPGNANLTALAGITIQQGDIFYAPATGQITRLQKGTTGQILTQGAEIPYWSTGSSSITGTKKQVVYFDSDGNPTSNANFIFDDTGNVLNVKYVATNKITFPGTNNYITFDGTNIVIVSNGQSITLQNGSTLFTGIAKYFAEYSLTDRKHLAYKGYIDDSITALGNVVSSNVTGTQLTLIAPSNGDIPVYNSSTKNYENKTLSPNTPQSQTCLNNTTTYIDLGDATVYRTVEITYGAVRGTKYGNGKVIVLSNGTDAIPGELNRSNLPDNGDQGGWQFTARVQSGIIQLGVEVDSSDVNNITFSYLVEAKI